MALSKKRLNYLKKAILIYCLGGIVAGIFSICCIILDYPHRLQDGYYRYTVILDKEVVRSSRVLFIPEEYKYRLKIEDRYSFLNGNIEYKNAYAYSTIDYKVGDVVPYYLLSEHKDEDNQVIVEIKMTKEKFFPIKCITWGVNILCIVIVILLIKESLKLEDPGNN